MSTSEKCVRITFHILKRFSLYGRRSTCRHKTLSLITRRHFRQTLKIITQQRLNDSVFHTTIYHQPLNTFLVCFLYVRITHLFSPFQINEPTTAILCINLKCPEMQSKVIFGHPKWPTAAIMSKIKKIKCFSI